MASRAWTAKRSLSREAFKLTVYLTVPVALFGYFLLPGRLDSLIDRYRFVTYPPEHPYWQEQRRRRQELRERAAAVANEQHAAAAAAAIAASSSNGDGKNPPAGSS